MTYTWEYIKNESNEVTGILVNGKPIKKSYLNAFLKAQKTSYFVLYEETGTFYNPHNGMPFVLNSLELTLVNWIYQWQGRYSVWAKRMDKKMQTYTEAPVQTFDNLRYFTMDLPNDDCYFLIN